MRGSARDDVIIGRRARIVRRVAGILVGSAGLLAAGCAGGTTAAAPGEHWSPPRGGLAMHRLADESAALAGRSDDRLGHLPRREPVFSSTRIDQRSRLTTSGSGRITDSVSRRVESTTIYRRR